MRRMLWIMFPPATPNRPTADSRLTEINSSGAEKNQAEDARVSAI